MKKIYLIIAGAFLILLIITSMLLSLQKKTTTTTQKGSAFPTDVPDQGKSGQSIDNLSPTGGNQGLKNLSDESNLSNPSNESNLSQITPIETEDFKLQYSEKLGKIVIEKKTPQAELQFANWAKQNQLTQLIDNPELILIVDQGKNPDDFNPVIEFLNIFMNFGQGAGTSNGQGNSSITNPNILTPTSSAPTGVLTKKNKLQPTISYSYFAQCGEFGEMPLPDGCTLCNAGCGPTAVSMIASSYLGPKYDPKTIVNIYDTNNYVLGCDGSRYQEAHELLKSLGLKTTDYLVFDAEKSETVIPDLKKYLNSGWTFFTLANFCEGGCGHYFWITDIDTKGNIWAYDPAYGRYEIPYNENSRYPFPLYRLAFGVKK
jgi:hypothetical protein